MFVFTSESWTPVFLGCLYVGWWLQQTGFLEGFALWHTFIIASVASSPFSSFGCCWFLSYFKIADFEGGCIQKHFLPSCQIGAISSEMHSEALQELRPSKTNTRLKHGEGSHKADFQHPGTIATALVKCTGPCCKCKSNFIFKKFKYRFFTFTGDPSQFHAWWPLSPVCSLLCHYTWIVIS